MHDNQSASSPINTALSPEELASYVSGNANYMDAQLVELAITSDGRALQRLRDYRYIWNTAGDLPIKVDTPAAWDSVLTDVSQRRRWRTRRRVAGISAFTAVGIVAALVTKVMPYQDGSSLPSSSVGQAYEYATGIGERREFHLPDGTVATLNAASKLRIPAGSDRAVELDGEAVFKVAHNTDRAFRVISNGTDIKVLGTVFGVRSYSGSATSVSVASGKIAFATSTNTTHSKVTTLSAGDVAVATSSGIEVKHVDNVESQFAWITGKQQLRDVPVREVAAELLRWYNLRIEVSDAELGSRVVTTTLDIKPPTPNQLRDLAASVGAQLETGANGTYRLVLVTEHR